MLCSLCEQTIYYIQNAATERFIEVEGPSTASGAYIQQWQYHGNNSEKWLVEHVSNSDGYIRLKSVYSGLYMGVDSSNTSVIRQYSTQNDYTLWRLDRTERDNLRLACKATASNNIALAVPSATSGNGINLTQLAYVDTNEDEVIYDEWNCVKQVLSFVHYYDSSFDSQRQLSISGANTFANVVYSRYYNLALVMDSNASFYENAVADSCQVEKNRDPCGPSCGSDCYIGRNLGGHHKNVNVISDQLYYAPREENHVYVMWTQRNWGYCIEENGSHEGYNPFAVVIGYKPVIHVIRSFGSGASHIAQTGIFLAHETMHTLGVADVSNDGPHSTLDQTYCCLKESFDDVRYIDFYNNIMCGTELPFCNTCYASMRSFTSNVNIPGNIE